EVKVLHQGEALHFRERTWHYGYNFTQVETVIICTFAPVPPDIASAAVLAEAVPPLGEVRLGRWELLDRHPWNSAEAAAKEAFRILPPSAWLPVTQGAQRPIRVDLMVATEKQTSGIFSLLPGVTTDAEKHPGDEVAFCVSGQVGLYL